MRFSTAVLTGSSIVLAAALPTNTFKRADSCGQWDTVETGSYTVYNNLWGQSSATSGSQCFGVDGLSGDTLSWHTSWSWEGGEGQVKSYPNVVVSLDSKPLSEITSMQSSWSWSYDGSNIVADVAYDMFTSSTAGGSNEYEIMIWLAALGGAGPISSTYGADGSATPIATVALAGTNWTLYKGPNGDMTVFSFLADSEVTNFSGDLKEFIDYLASNQGLPSSQHLLSAGAGTEPFSGSDAVFTVSAYSLTIE
ncbi:hypothetical protein LTR37_014538 [Vermiconidia calcicola]|uniref:Uncharacterized protein n=1 Tax=Vermiconidia calcicola TaxID=1690605 RepID=A0ACC3MTE0_9PEZI|nr:hypothetical protein LTR37_014538 [Vermiconidia calcicola]